MSPATVAFTLLVILSISLLENADAQPRDSFDIIRSMASLTAAVGNLSRVVQDLQTKVESQANLCSNLVTKEDLETLARNLEMNAGGQATLLATLVNKSHVQATASEQQGALLNDLMTKAEVQVASLNSLEAKVDVQTSLLHNLTTKEEVKATTWNNSVTKIENQADFLGELHRNVSTVGAQVETLSEESQISVKPESTVEGIVAGTAGGVVIISLDSKEKRTISNKDTTGVAFDWNTREVYWIENNVGIKRADLNGTSVELLVPDTSELWGLALDPITGNFYYGKRTPAPEVRVCGSSGKNCAVVASGADVVGKWVFDIALHPSEGIMFWSNVDHEKPVIRAAMDGGNATVIISEDIDGLDVDEVSRRLYWTLATKEGTIGSKNLNGGTRKVLLNATLSPSDVAVDGDTVYFGNLYDKSVYSVTQDRVLSLIANTTYPVRHIALYGRNKVPSRPNPCQNSPCPNVCVLNRDSYTCL